MEPTQKPCAEIIESSLATWISQSWDWRTTPAFGSLVVVEHAPYILFGIVYHIQTGSMDPIRYPFAYQKTEEELLREQPQIFEFLKTTFSCVLVGYQEKGKIFYQLPPEPPRIHSFVAHASTMQYKHFFAHEQYLHVLFNISSTINNLDELLLALLKTMRAMNCITERSTEKFLETFSLLTGNDYRRMKLFLQRAHVFFENQ